MSKKEDYPEIEQSDVEFEIKELTKKVIKLENENRKLMEVLKENDLLDELEHVSDITEEEYICVKGISHLKKLYENGTFEKNDTQQLEILVKLLKQIRGDTPVKSKEIKIKNNSVDNLLKIASSDE